MSDARLLDTNFNPVDDPETAHPDSVGDEGPTPAHLVTLFDRFAAAALQGCLAYVNPERGDCHTNATPEAVAEYCAGYAIAMLERRAKLFGVKVSP